MSKRKVSKPKTTQPAAPFELNSRTMGLLFVSGMWAVAIAAVVWPRPAVATLPVDKAAITAAVRDALPAPVYVLAAPAPAPAPVVTPAPAPAPAPVKVRVKPRRAAPAALARVYYVAAPVRCGCI